MRTAVTTDIALLILASVAGALIQGQDALRWLPHIEGILRDIHATPPQAE